MEVFALERPELNVDWYRYSVCSADRSPLRASGGLAVDVKFGVRKIAAADIVVIPGWSDVTKRPPESLLRAVRNAHQRGARFATICSGVFVLAYAGILDGMRVTTHWRYAERLAESFSSIEVDASSLYIDEGQILTSAGSAAGIDMLLHLVRSDFGPGVANSVAQRLVMAPHREGGQSQFVPRPVPAVEATPIAPLLDFIRTNPNRNHTVASMAARVHMSTRTFQRRFFEATGFTPQDWVVRERVARAKELLEASPGLSVDRVAETAGFGSTESMRHHFRALDLPSPTSYRRNFATS